ncbi:MAG: alanine:cation symporter family protein [Leptolyngbya sp. SIO3F4]|nr:alanine:cation symporter family protein [Leptolyngbya sp. SIO3F4]
MQNVDLALGNFRINFIEYVILALIHAMGWCVLLGHCLERRFSNSDTTLLKRHFSYLLTLIFATFVIGLTGTRVEKYDVSLNLVLITLLSLIYCIVLMVALSPVRQTLKDWTRFRHAKPRHERLSLWKDLVIGDTSSPVIAIALNLFILTSIVVTAFFAYYGDFLLNKFDVLILVFCLFMFIGSILFSTLVSQTLLMLPRKKNWIWLGAVSSISCLAFPSLSLVMGIFVFSPYPSPTHMLGIPSPLAVLALPLSLLGTLTTILAVVHTQQLIRSGRSESQKLLSNA